MTATRRFDTTGLSQLQGSKHPFHIRAFLDPWRSDHHNVTKRRLPITWWHSGVTRWSVIDKNGHLICTAANAQQLFSPASACCWFNSTTITILSTSQKPSNPPGIGAVAGRRRLRSTTLLNEAISSAVRCHTIIILTENARRIKFPEVICDNSLCNVFVISLEFLYWSGTSNVLKDREVRVVCRR